MQLPHFIGEKSKSTEKASSHPEVIGRERRQLGWWPTSLTYLGAQAKLFYKTFLPLLMFPTTQSSLLSQGDTLGLPTDSWEGSASVGLGNLWGEALTGTVMQLLEGGGLAREHRADKGACCQA